ncbi:nucleotide exchange factor GrpE, partial [Streptomyces sp. NPDC059538]
MSEETPGFDEKPEVPDAGQNDAEPKAADSATEEAAAPAGAPNPDLTRLAPRVPARKARGPP